MRPHCSNEVVQVLLHIKKLSKLFARATLYDINMQAESPTTIAISAFLFGLYAAGKGSSEKFSREDVLVVQEAWRNVVKDISSHTDDEMKQLMLEKARMLAQIFVQMRSLETEQWLNIAFPREITGLLPTAEETTQRK